MVRSASNQEQNVQLAVASKEQKKFRSLRQSASFYNVPKSTTTYRANGRVPRHKVNHAQRRLTIEEEEVVVKWIKNLQRQYLSPNYIQAQVVVTSLLRAKGDFQPLGVHWITNFHKRHPEISAGKSRKMEMSRLESLDTAIVNSFFNEITTLQTQYQIPWSQVYNMDEKGFQMGQNVGDYVLFNALQGPPIAPSTSISKWVTAVECISATGTILPPLIIYIGQEPSDHWFPTDLIERAKDWQIGFSKKG